MLTAVEGRQPREFKRKRKNVDVVCSWSIIFFGKKHHLNEAWWMPWILWLTELCCSRISISDVKCSELPIEVGNNHKLHNIALACRRLKVREIVEHASIVSILNDHLSTRRLFLSWVPQFVHSWPETCDNFEGYTGDQSTVRALGLWANRRRRKLSWVSQPKIYGGS